MICCNVLGGCMGTTGPRDVNPATGKPYGLTFPIITIADMVRAQVRIIDHLGIDQLFCVIGGSLGGLPGLQWSAPSPQRGFSALPNAARAPHSAADHPLPQAGRPAARSAPL